jgi:phosphatidylglycerol:prolipoprotein diacylglycerol transferase
VDPEKILDLCLYIILAAVAGSRLLYVATRPDYFLAHPLEVVMIWKGGLVFYGGFLGAALAALLYVRRQGLPLGKCADIAALALPLGHCLGRIGCFMAGCCYGKPSDLPWAVTFSHPEALAPLGIPLHPTQLYHAFGNLIIFLSLLFLRRHKRFDSQLFWLYLIFYGMIRSLLEVFRGDDRGAVLLDLFSLSQVLGVTIAVVSAGVFFALWKQNRASCRHG